MPYPDVLAPVGTPWSMQAGAQGRGVVRATVPARALSGQVAKGGAGIGGGGTGGSGGGGSCSSSSSSSAAPPRQRSEASASARPIRYANGEILLVDKDLSSNGFGHPWGHSRSYANRLSSNSQEPNGDRWYVAQMPQIVQGATSSSIAIMGVDEDPIWFTGTSGTGPWTPLFFQPVSLTQDTGAAQEFRFKDANGTIFKFHSFDTSINVALRGKFKSFQDPGGNLSTPTYDGSNRLTGFAQSSGAGGTTSAFEYSYLASGANSGRLENVTQKRSSTSIRRTVNSYHQDGDTYGKTGDLKTVKVQQWDSDAGVWNDLETSYYRYYTASSGTGFVHGLKYKAGPEAYARMVAAGVTPETTSDATLATYADYYFEYDSQQRVTREKTNGGLYQFDFAYASPSAHANGYNNWKNKTTETLPGGQQKIVYTNYVGQPILSIFKDGSNEWYEYSKYDSGGRLIEQAESFAVSSYSEANAGLVTLKTSAGLIHVFDYYTTTDIPTGKVQNYLQRYRIKNGSSGTPISVREWKYTSRSAGGDTIYPVSTETEYRSDASGGSSGVDTQYTYTWIGSTLQVDKRTTTFPAVATGQNGSGSTTSREEVFDIFGRRIWLKDERGKIFRTTYDDASGAVTQQIDDVDTDLVSGVPAGWSNPNGLHLVSDFEFDNLGRLTQELGPSHSIDLAGTNTTLRRARWSVYQDTIGEVWQGMGYATGSAPSYTYTLINPVDIVRSDRSNRLTAQIRATRSGTSGALTASDSFPQTSWVRWSRTNYDNNSRVEWTRLYHTIPSSGDGTSGANYDETDYGYSSRGELNKVVSPGGTIRRSVFNGIGWLSSSWMGTNDTGATDSNPAGSGSPNNMVRLVSYEYDGNVAKGDGNLTKETRHVDASVNRVTNFGYDWRNRLTSMDGEIDLYEAYEYDNQDRLTRTDRRNTTGGGTLIGREDNLYDNLGRGYRHIRYAVNPSTGAVGNQLQDDVWFDALGNVIKRRNAGSATLEKHTYDGVSRRLKSYTTYTTISPSYSEAQSVADDVVFRQEELTYDAAGNVISNLLRRRFHDAGTTVGELTTPGGANPKARVSYQAVWHDALGRVRNLADYGTNGAASFTRPAVAPARSDTVLVTSLEFDSSGEQFKAVDPKGRDDRKEFDQAGRIKKTIENYVDGVPSGDTDRTTEYAYTSDSLLKSLTAKNSTTGDQVTKFVYGATVGASESDVASSELLIAKIFPDSDDVESPLGNGPDGLFDRVEYRYNRQGELKRLNDQNGSEHAYDYDLLGRLTHDRVTTAGFLVDNAVLRISRTFEVRGLLEKVTSVNNATVGSGTVVNEIQYVYNDFELLTSEYQEHGGAVNTGTSLRVQYAYTSGADNHTRRTSITYPNARVLTIDYGTSGFPNDLLSRVAAIKDGTTTCAAYSFLGLDTFVRVDYQSQPGVELTYLKQGAEPNGDGGDQYAGLDRFDRVVDQRWLKTSDGTARERVAYGYDRAGNRVWRENQVAASGQDEFYTYDGLYQLLTLDRGDLNAGKTGISGTPAFEEDFGFDPTGNWSSYLTKASGTTSLNQTRTHNKANEITGVAGTPNWFDPTFDGNGNTKQTPQIGTPTSSYDLKYDAWNRLVQVKVTSGSVVGAYVYDGLHRRVRKTTPSPTRDYYYSRDWQVLEERVSGAMDRQFVWGTRYLDDLILRDRTAERFYVLHDYFHVTGIIDTSAAVQERYGYDAYGLTRVMTSSFGSRASSLYAWELRYGAYYWDSESELYYVRHRYLHPSLGRWLSRDRLGEQDGPNLYGYTNNKPISHCDPLGLLLGCTPDPCKNACDTYQRQNPSNTDAGGVVCCGGKKFSCVWKPTGGGAGTNKKATEIISRCIRIHERTHFPETTCPTGPGVTRPEPTFPPGTDPQEQAMKEECEGYRTEMHCLRNTINFCRGDAVCNVEVLEQLRFVQSQVMANCTP